ncbi:uncharacterized protein [Musca autumnalis]|uniref:uncharacterized protein n=1 Tax=Musca autumnalis TaxID=221902 RepID=UPI003CE6BFBC
MEKSSYINSGPRRAPEGAATSTQSGVTVYDPSPAMNHPPPPSYDQATGAAPIPAAAAATTVTHNVSYNTTSSTQWGSTQGPIAASTQYVTYTTPASSSTTTYHYAPAQPQPPPPSHQPHIHQQQPGVGQPSVVIIQQPMLPLGPEPVYITCPACHVQKLTRIEYEPSSRTHLMAALLCLFGLWCCVCLPYCAGSCMNAQHYCGNCGKFLGTYGNTL